MIEDRVPNGSWLDTRYIIAKKDFTLREIGSTFLWALIGTLTVRTIFHLTSGIITSSLPSNLPEFAWSLVTRALKEFSLIAIAELSTPKGWRRVIAICAAYATAYVVEYYIGKISSIDQWIVGLSWQSCGLLIVLGFGFGLVYCFGVACVDFSRRLWQSQRAK